MVALHLLMTLGALAATGETVLLNFTGPNCPHCRAMEPVLGELEAGGMPVRTINVEQHPEMAQRFGVTGIPTFVMIVDDQEAGRVVGSAPAAKLTALFPTQLAGAIGELRGQSPGAAPNHVGQRLGSLFGRGGDSAPAGAAPAADPFLRQPPAAAAHQAGAVQPAGHLQAISPPASGPRTSLDPKQQAMAASVRLKVEDDNGHSLGSGTIIDTHGDEAVIVTCGHIFRDSQGQGRIVVDLFYPQPRTIEGKLLEYDLKRDIAMITIAPGPGVAAAPVLPDSQQMTKGDVAFSIGCDRGQDPSLRDTHITGLDRYQGPPNIEAKGQPVDGRSGGGLFSSEGYLIGVCNAADPADDEGIYAALGTIYWQLGRVGLEELYQAPATAVATVGANLPDDAAQQSSDPNRPLPELPSRLATPQAVIPPAGVASSSDTEVICIVRSKSNPAYKGQVFIIEGATPELLQQLAASSSDATLAADMALQSGHRSAMSLPAPNGPVVRGQSQR
jgi:S1-C subfamily serine protease